MSHPIDKEWYEFNKKDNPIEDNLIFKEAEEE